MIKIHYLGTCSGTEPMPNMHHTSTVLEVNGALYWFDTGECCVHTAFSMGLDIMKTKAIFVSHPHIDHIGGMANLLFAFDKMIVIHKMALSNNEIDLFFPDHNTFEAIKTLSLSGRIGRSDFKFKLNEHPLANGVLYDDGTVRVTAKSNGHIPYGEDGTPYAFSFLVEAEGKKLLFSGDVKAPCDLDPLINGGVDLLVMETGHHKVSDVCEYAISHGAKKLRFNHHGREILGNRSAAEALISDYEKQSGISIKLTYDTLSEEY